MAQVQKRIKGPLFLHGLRCQLGIPLVLPVPDGNVCHCGNIVRSVDLTSPRVIDENDHATNKQPHELTKEPLHQTAFGRTSPTRKPESYDRPLCAGCASRNNANCFSPTPTAVPVGAAFEHHGPGSGSTLSHLAPRVGPKRRLSMIPPPC